MMLHAAPADQRSAPVGVLFSPDTVPVIDIFRALGDFEHYDVAALEAIERRLSGTMAREAAKGIVSDALLLAFGLRRGRVRPIEFRPVLSRRGSLDEYRLAAVLGAAFWHDFALATRAAGALGVQHPDPLVALAFDIARRLEAAGTTLTSPDARLFGEDAPCAPPHAVQVALASADLKWRFEF